VPSSDNARLSSVRAVSIDPGGLDLRFRVLRGTRASKRVACTLLAAASITGPVVCTAEGWFLTIGGGVRNIEVDGDSAVANNLSIDENVVAELGAGYVFSNGVVLEGAATDGASVSGLFGSGTYEFDDYQVMAGYAFAVGEKFRIVPTGGASFWKFRATTSFPLPSSERSLSGTDFVWRLAGEYLAGETFGISFGYTRNDFDVGDTSLLSVGVRIQF
jgi:hypothetical protein